MFVGMWGWGTYKFKPWEKFKDLPPPPQDLFKKKLHCKKSQKFDAILRMVKKKKKG